MGLRGQLLELVLGGCWKVSACGLREQLAGKAPGWPCGARQARWEEGCAPREGWACPQPAEPVACSPGFPEVPWG